MPNVYDYMNSSGRAVRDGYKPCYLTRVSTVICNVTDNYSSWWGRYINFGLDESLRDNIKSFPLMITMLLIMLTLPINCWFLALLLPKEGDK